MLREVIFNTIYVIQSLPEDETQTGTNLFNDIIQRRAKYQFEDLDSFLINNTTKGEFINTLKSMESDFHRKAILPYIHFEIHGCKEGLVLKNKELIKWEELSILLTKINFNTKNNLFVSLATCFGGYIFNAVNPLGQIPFYAFVGPTTEVTQKEVEVDWEAYFEKLLTTKDFTTAINALNQSNPKTPYIFRTSEDIFDIVARGLINMYATREARRKQIQRLTKLAKKVPGNRAKLSDATLKQFFASELDNYPKYIQQRKDYFLMKTDTLPSF